MADRSGRTPSDLALLARAAETLALPERVCRRRACRRRGRCSWFFEGTQEPCCLANLDAGHRRLLDEFAAYVRNARDFGSWESGVVFASPWRGERALQDAAVEAARPLLAGAALHRFRRFARRRERQPPPACDGFHSPREA